MLPYYAFSNRNQALGQDPTGGSGDTPANATRAESRIRYIAGQTAVSIIRAAFPSWYLRPTDFAQPNGFNLSAAIEYNGVTTPFTFAGQNNQDVATFPYLAYTDPLTISIPAGATFYIRTGMVVAAGNKFLSAYVVNNTGEGAVINTSGSSQVNSTGVLVLNGGASKTQGYGPVAVLGNSNQHCAIVAGDSIATDTGDTNGDGNGNYGFVARGIYNSTANVPYIKMTVSANQVQDAVISKYQALMLGGGTHFISELGVNDLNQANSGNYTVAAIEANYLTLWARSKALGLKVYQTLITPLTTSTDNWATAANQTPVARFGVGQDRDTINTWIKARVTDATIDGYIDVNQYAEDQSNLGKWVSNGSANYGTIDGTHPSTAMHVLMAQAVTTTVNGW